MISVTHTPAEELIGEEEDYPIPVGGTRMELDWQRVAAAFDAAGERFGWGAHVRIHPERRLVEILVPPGITDRVACTTHDFYAAVADEIGMEAFMSVWVDFDVAR